MKPVAIRRREPAGKVVAVWPQGVHPQLARIYAARGIGPDDVARSRLIHLATPGLLGGMARACELLADAIDRGLRICIVGDFDADGATGTAVAVRGLRLLGARDVGYRVPNRFRDGYGLSPGLVESLHQADRTDLIVTVDNGIASHAGVARAGELGIAVIVTDHHLPGEVLPAAAAIVNPNLSGDAFPSKALAGVGVMFYLLLALRAHRRDGGAYATCGAAEPDLSVLLDLVALGTVADLVPLDANNRILVDAGLKKIRAGRCCAGIAALYRVGKRDPARAVAGDLGFVLGPRINAAGRIDDMALGIECLLADDNARAQALAEELSAINAQRQDLQAAMVEQAETTVTDFLARHREEDLPCGIVLHEPDWHPGIVGLVASRLKDRLHRPVIACAPSEPGSNELRGSARSIAGFHLRDALAEVDVRCPGLIGRFGGHAMAAGLSLGLGGLARFAAEFDAVARSRCDESMLERFLWSDGDLAAADFSTELAQAFRYAGPWGQGFAEPAFDNVFDVESWRAVGEKHLRLVLRHDGRADSLEGIMFNAQDCMPPPPRLRAVFQLDLDEWNGRERLRLLVRHIEAA